MAGDRASTGFPGTGFPGTGPRAADKTGGVTVVPSVAVTGQPFKTATSFSSKMKGKQWEAQALAQPTSAIKAGDTLLASFYIRSTSPASGSTVDFNFQDGAPPYKITSAAILKLTSKWQKVSMPFAAKNTYDGKGKKWMIAFQMGSMPQTIQVANFSIVDYGKSKTVGSLPKAGV